MNWDSSNKINSVRSDCLLDPDVPLGEGNDVVFALEDFVYRHEEIVPDAPSVGRVANPVEQFEIDAGIAETAVVHPGRRIDGYGFYASFSAAGAALALLSLICWAWLRGSRKDQKDSAPYHFSPSGSFRAAKKVLIHFSFNLR